MSDKREDETALSDLELRVLRERVAAFARCHWTAGETDAIESLQARGYLDGRITTAKGWEAVARNALARAEDLQEKLGEAFDEAVVLERKRQEQQARAERAEVEATAAKEACAIAEADCELAEHDRDEASAKLAAARQLGETMLQLLATGQHTALRNSLMALASMEPAHE